MSDYVEILPRTYHDSVRLMQVSAAVQAVPGVEAALVAMGTELNLDSLAAMGFADVAALADDLVVAIRAGDDEALAVARRTLARAFETRRETVSDSSPVPLSIVSAAAPIDANLALISVPGSSAYVEAADALGAGLHVMVFSNNVAVEDEVALKREAAARGLLVMGPDCGTAIVHGVGLGFANAVTPGPVGIVGASGTGIQQVCCLLDDAGVGVRHALGTGSRDLSADVGGIATVQCLRALDGDPAVDVIAVISKPPAAAVAERIRTEAAACDTPTVMIFIGESTLEDGAAAVLEVLGCGQVPHQQWGSVPGTHRPGALRGLFSGGTLCGEAGQVAGAIVGSVAEHLGEAGHVMVDFGRDEYTQGRPHPMIDQRIRLEALDAAAADTTVGVILLDVVLGFGAHPDPGGELASHVGGAVEQGAAVVVSLCGTAADPQDRERQATVLAAAGAEVWSSNAAAARRAAVLVGGGDR